MILQSPLPTATPNLQHPHVNSFLWSCRLKLAEQSIHVQQPNDRTIEIQSCPNTHPQKKLHPGEGNCTYAVLRGVEGLGPISGSPSFNSWTWDKPPNTWLWKPQASPHRPKASSNELRRAGNRLSTTACSEALFEKPELLDKELHLLISWSWAGISLNLVKTLWALFQFRLKITYLVGTFSHSLCCAPQHQWFFHVGHSAITSALLLQQAAQGGPWWSLTPWRWGPEFLSLMVTCLRDVQIVDWDTCSLSGQHEACLLVLELQFKGSSFWAGILPRPGEGLSEWGGRGMPFCTIPLLGSSSLILIQSYLDTCLSSEFCDFHSADTSARDFFIHAPKGWYVFAYFKT